MSISREVKQQLISEYATHEGDTGSPEVQVAVVVCCSTSTPKTLNATVH